MRSSVVRLSRQSFRSLALSVHFKHPDLKMDDYEILSRASCFLLSVDPENKLTDGPSGHLDEAESRRKERAFKRIHGHSPAAEGGKVSDMGWLEFAPREYRPTVHVVASSHVLSPYLWKDYYPQEWLSLVKSEHCRFSVEVLDQPGNSLAKFALEGDPYHHPEGRDLALVHFKDEKTTLPILKNLGVEVLHLRDDHDKLFEKGENMFFDGYAVAEEDEESDEEKKSQDDDGRIFVPLTEKGTLNFHTQDRFFAGTETPLPEGMCGAPAVDDNGKCSGVVEGIVPVTHENKDLAGSAAFMPSYVMKAFIEFVERQMLRELMPEDLFQLCVAARKTNTIGGGMFKVSSDGKPQSTNWEDSYEEMTKEMKKYMSKEEFEAYMAILDDEKEYAKEIIKKEGGGDVMEAIERARARTIAIQEMVHREYKKHHDGIEAGAPEK